MRIADAFGGEIINADSMQVYRELQIITARPTPADEAAVTHHLYGCKSAAEPCSVGNWAAMVAPVIRATLAAGRVPVVTGGTGLYLKALVEGLADIPAPSNAVRREVQARYDTLGGAAFRKALGAVDRKTARQLNDADRQRLTRAMEIFEATGRPMSAWLGDGNRPVINGVLFRTIVIEPPRDTLYASVNNRFEAMMQAGALDEVETFLALGLDAALPASKAVGVCELGRYIAGTITLETAVRDAQQASRNYAKRQMTWFRNHIRKDLSIPQQHPEKRSEEIFSFIRQTGLTRTG